jgi:hypothetical protein
MRSVLRNSSAQCWYRLNPPVIAISILAFFSSLQTASADTQVSAIDLQPDVFEHIQFSKIRANDYTFDDGQLVIEVDDSASFLMLPFDTVKHVSEVRFRWQSHGKLHTRDAHHEKLREGDDALCKLGLLLKTEAGWPNPFTPKWLKRVSKLLNFTSEKMINQVAGAKHAAGEHSVGPYNKRVTMISVNSVADRAGWQQASYHFEQPVAVVALWIMADGDDTPSSFTTRIRDIEIE